MWMLAPVITCKLLDRLYTCTFILIASRENHNNVGKSIPMLEKRYFKIQREITAWPDKCLNMPNGCQCIHSQTSHYLRYHWLVQAKDSLWILNWSGETRFTFFKTLAAPTFAEFTSLRLHYSIDCFFFLLFTLRRVKDENLKFPHDNKVQVQHACV